jgi:pimeloyl-ACP methyl ester carboxylesterase
MGFRDSTIETMSTGKATIVLIHGLWMSPHSWSGWIERYSAAGHTVLAPACPGVSELDEELDHGKVPADIRPDGLQAVRGPTASDGGVGRLGRRGRLRVDVDSGTQRIV